MGSDSFFSKTQVESIFKNYLKRNILRGGEDADNLARDTISEIAGGVANTPAGFGVGVIITYGVSPVDYYLLQVAFNNEARVWTRYFRVDAWGEWEEVSPKSTNLKIATGGLDANNFERDTSYGISGGVSNVPPGYTVGTIETFGVTPSDKYLIQRATDNGSRMWTRYYAGGSWGSWTPVNSSRGYAFSYGSVDFNTLTRGTVHAHTGAFTNGPAGMVAGIVTTKSITNADTYLQQTAEGWSYSGVSSEMGIWTRRRNSTTWSDWTKIGPVDDSAYVKSGGYTHASGVKTVAVPVTVGHNPAPYSVESSGSVRVPINVRYPVSRWRLRIQNIDIRSGSVSKTGSANITDLYIGAHDGNGGFSSSPTLVFSDIGVSNQETITPWTTVPLRRDDGEVLISYNYTASGEHWAQLGTAYFSASQTAGDISSLGYSSRLRQPWSVILEVETWSTTPVLASLGDSISVGVGSTRGTIESWINQYCLNRGIIPVMGGCSGDSVSGYSDRTSFKWTRWLNLRFSSPDAIVFALGVNDFGNGSNASRLKDLVTELMPKIMRDVPTVYLTTITPRSNVAETDPREIARIEYNQWVRSMPLNVRGYWDFLSAISANGSDIDADKDADGLHPNSLGHRTLSQTMGVMTSPPVNYQ